MEEIVRNRGIGTDIRMYDPFDVLYHINSEIASLAYAHKAEILTPEILPYVAHFRSLQSNEKIALLGAMVDKLGIESNERIALMGEITTRYGIDSDERKHNRSEDGLNFRTRIQAQTLDGICAREQAGMTEREIIHANSAYDLQKIKYEARRLIVENQGNVQKYLSDNEVKATQIEAEALAGAIRFSAEARRDGELGKANARVREAEIAYASGIARAEKMRDIASINQRGQITKAYIEAQAGIMRASVTGEAQVNSASYRALETGFQESARVLRETGKDYVRFRGGTGHGDVWGEIDLQRKK
jgi:hypothetical protein